MVDRTTPEYKDYVLERLEVLDEITCRLMMGEYLLYYQGLLFGGIYNNRVLVKIVGTNEAYHLPEEIPYKGAKPMYQIEDLEDREQIREIILNTCEGLPKKK